MELNLTGGTAFKMDEIRLSTFNSITNNTLWILSNSIVFMDRIPSLRNSECCFRHYHPGKHNGMNRMSYCVTPPPPPLPFPCLVEFVPLTAFLLTQFSSWPCSVVHQHHTMIHFLICNSYCWPRHIQLQYTIGRQAGHCDHIVMNL